MSFRSFLAAIKTCSCPSQGRQLFDKLPKKSSSFYNAMIKCHIQFQESGKALRTFTEMLTSGQHQPDNFTFPVVLKACSELSMLDMGMAVHCQVWIGGFQSDIYVQNSLISMYMNCDKEEEAARVFSAMHDRNVISWNSMISGYSRNGNSENALMAFDRMVCEDVEPDHATVVSVLPACANLKGLQWGKRVHEMVEKKGLGTVAVKNALVDMYAKCECLHEAQLVFDGMNERDVVSWTAMVGGYVYNGDGSRALALCYPMLLEGVRPNSVTVAALLSACVNVSSLKHGKCIHSWVLRCGLESDVLVETALVDLYAKCNRINLSLHVFNKTSRRRTVPWNSIITGHVHNGLAGDAIELFKQMQVEAVDLDGATLLSLLPAYAHIADLNQAENIHGYLIRSGFGSRVEIATGMIHVYSKCGCLEKAHKVFDMIHRKDNDIISWSAIIACYAMHGHGEVAISLFDQMMQAGVRPNEVTFTSLLHACSHAGLVDEGLRLFKTMFMQGDLRTQYADHHFTCIIDILGRAGRLKEAFELIATMPFEPSHAVWGALLGGCVIHEDVELGELAAKKLFKLEPNNTGNYILLSKIYAAAGRWEDVENVRTTMSEMGLRKTPGCSSIEVKNVGSLSGFVR
ncbi:hypothetical protein Syun_006285 [Stephania yunnanensis]|uniref:Pentatricopeptide repeat-containing protein n=1 Tax=Stephania yunnanensis TaxID=152371 RepID=A0AAP0KZP7_9MAGN